jgi:hypothetical protein
MLDVKMTPLSRTLLVITINSLVRVVILFSLYLYKKKKKKKKKKNEMIASKTNVKKNLCC